jgi:hypothetical protein
MRPAGTKRIAAFTTPRYYERGCVLDEELRAMPNLTLENVPQELFDELQRAAQVNQRNISEEVLQRLVRRQLLDEPFLTEETSAPSTIGPPELSKIVMAKRIQARLPDPPWIIAGAPCPVCELAASTADRTGDSAAVPRREHCRG